MKNKKKQLIKGIMLSTALGLGWGVAGDISHAAGSELAQKQGPAEWNSDVFYKVGDIVTYNENQYVLVVQLSMRGVPPYEYDGWKRIAEQHLNQWNEMNTYDIGEMVSFDGSLYEAQRITNNIPGGQNDDWEKIDKVILQWNENNRYVIDDIVMHKGTPYKALESTMGIEPDKNNTKWISMNGFRPVKEGDTSQAKDTPNSKTVEHEGETYKVKYSNHPGGQNLYLQLTKQNGKEVWKPLLTQKQFDGLVSIEKEGDTSRAKNTPVVPK
ncbi:hypothetical protein CN553_27735 [Bacillus cereus]|uniref:Uncharacterized protein n=1 Tax=Bacillus cereus TaxID=1396 RepID=A0A9X6U6R7_BACCE|nr:hypothetical protein [Bacillus cereus]PEN84503.1 hypothetical protein CN553_27735 [Bacillus cereus]